MTNEELEEIKKKHMIRTPTKAEQKAPPPTGQPGLLDEIQRGLRRGLVTGATSVADLVGLGVEQSVKAAGAPKQLDLPSATRLAEKAGLPKVSTAAGRIAEGTTGGATLGAAAGPPGIAIGAAAGFTGAAGVEIARLFTDDPIIQTGAGLLFGLSGGGVLRGVEAAGKAAGTLVPTVRRRILEAQMQRLLAGHIPDMEATMQAAQGAQQVARKVPGYQPSLAEVVPAAQSASRILRQSDPEISATQNKRLERNQEAMVNKAERMAKSLSGNNMEHVRKSALSRQENMTAANEAKVVRMQDDFDDALRPIREEVGDLPEASVFGNNLKTSLDTSYKAKQAEFDELFQQYDVTVQADPAPALTALKKLEAGAKKAEAEDLPSIFIRDIVRNFEGAEPLGEIRAVRSRLLHEYRQEAAGAAPNKNKLRMINELQDGVEGTIEQGIGQTKYAELKQLNAQYKEFKQTFQSDAVGNALNLVRTGGEKKSAIDVFNDFTSTTGGKGIEHFQALQKAVGDKEARRLYGQALMGKMMLSPGVRKADGTFNPKAIQSFIQKHERVIQELPDLQLQMSVLQRTAGKMVAAPKKPPTLADFDNAYARALVGEDPSRVTKKIIQSGNMGEGLKYIQAAFGDDIASFRAISRPLWDELMDQAGIVRPSETTTAMIAHPQLGPLLQKHKEGLVQFYGKETYDGLVDIHRAAKLNAESPLRLDPQMNVVKSNLSGMLKTIWSRAFGIARGVIGPQFTSAEVFSRRIANLVDAFDERETRAIMDNLLHDPDLIGILTKVRSVKDTLQAERSLKRWVKANVIPTVGVTAQQTFDAQRSRRKETQSPPARQPVPAY